MTTTNEITQLEAIEVAVTRIEPDEATMEQMLEVLQPILFIKEQAKLREAQWKEKAIAWCLKNDKDIVNGDLRYYVANPKDEKCIDIPGCIEALMAACNGDFNLFCTALSTGAIKPGASKKMLPKEDWEKFFKVTFRTVLKEDGTEKPQLQNINERFIK